MKKTLLLLFLLILNISAWGQQVEIQLLGKAFELSYNSVENSFKLFVDKKLDSNTNFQTYDQSTLAVEIYKIAEKKFKPEIEKLSSWENLKVSLSSDEAINDDQFLIKLTDVFDYDSFQITKKEDTVYSIQPVDNLFSPVGESEITFKGELQDNKEDFLKEVNQNLKAALQNKTEEIKANAEALINEKLQELRDNMQETTYRFLTDENLLPKGIADKENFTFKYNKKGNMFTMSVCGSVNAVECKVYGPYGTTIGPEEFSDNLFLQHQQFEQDASNRYVLIGIHAKLLGQFEKLRSDEFVQDLNASLVATATAQEEQEARKNGVIKAHSSVKLYKFPQKVKNDKKDNSKKRWKKNLYEAGKFSIHLVALSFFNNRVDEIAIKGHVQGSPCDTVTLSNRVHSLPLREFNNRDIVKIFKDCQGTEYVFYYDDILDYSPKENSIFNNSVRNIELTLKPEEEVTLDERKLADYFTGIFFSDFLGLNTQNSNGLLLAEARIRFPFHFRNYGFFTLFDNLTIYGSANLFSGFENNQRSVQLDDIQVSDPTMFNPQSADELSTDNFNLLLNNNVDAGFNLTFSSFEWKGANTFFHLKYGLRFLRTAVNYDLVQSQEVIVEGETQMIETPLSSQSLQVYSIGQELDLNLEFRPQANIGADLTVGLNWFGSTGTNNNDVDFDTTNNSPNLKVMANLYSLTNPQNNKAGLFFRMGGHYNLGNYRLFPQLMVGYATNLTSFVNKLSPNDDDK